MRAPSSLPCGFAALLLTVLVCFGDGVTCVIFTPTIFWEKYRHSRPEGGKYRETAETPPSEVRLQFDGMDYEYPPHQVSTMAEKRDHYTCTGEYSRCILREPKPTNVCAVDTSTFFGKYWYRFNSICDVEYENCLITREYTNYDLPNYRWNNYIYDGDGFLLRLDTGWFQSKWWYCYLSDVQYEYNNYRRALHKILRRAAVALDLSKTSQRQ